MGWEKGVEILRRIEAAEMELPKIPAELSEEAKDLLECCFVRKPAYRATCESLLSQPFVEGIDDAFDEEYEDSEHWDHESVSDDECGSDSSELCVEDDDDDEDASEVGDNMGDEYLFSYLAPEEEESQTVEDDDAMCSTSAAAFHQPEKVSSTSCSKRMRSDQYMYLETGSIS